MLSSGYFNPTTVGGFYSGHPGIFLNLDTTLDISYLQKDKYGVPKILVSLKFMMSEKIVFQTCFVPKNSMPSG